MATRKQTVLKQEESKEKLCKKLTCFYCGKKGHIEIDCFKRKRDAEQGIVKPIFNKEKKKETSKNGIQPNFV